MLTIGRLIYLQIMVLLLSLGRPNVTFSGFLNNTDVNRFMSSDGIDSAVIFIKRPVMGMLKRCYFSEKRTAKILIFK